MHSRVTILQTAALGLAAGATFGGLDVCLSYGSLPGYRSFALLLAAWLAAALAGAACGVVLGSVLRIAGRSALGPPIVAWGLLAAIVNFHVLRVYRADLFGIRFIGVNVVLLVLLVLLMRSALAARLGRSGPRLAGVAVVGWGLALVGLVWITGGFGKTLVAGRDNESPSILWLVLDTTRADSLSCYGGELVATPALDRLARGGVRFERAYAAASWTLPSHASMFTGTYPSTHGLTGLVARFEGSAHLAQRDLAGTTLAEVLGRAGYATLAFSENPWVSRRTSLGRGFEEFHDVWDLQGRRYTVLERALKWAQSRGWLPWSLSRYTVASITRRLGELDPQTPFFVFVNFLDPHAPYTPAAAQRRAVLDGAEVSAAVSAAANDPMVYVAGEVDLGDGEMETLRRLYEAEVAYLDEQIGELLAALEASGRLDHTIVIATSDHGENFGWQGLASHAFAINDELLRVPLIVHAPGKVLAGKVVDTNVSLVDLFPTVLGMTGVPFDAADRLEGHSLLPLLEDGEASAIDGRAVFAEESVNVALLQAARKDYPSFDWSRYERALRSVRREGLKYVWSSDGRHSLYDVSSDPFEQDNLLPQQADRADELASILQDWLRSVEQKRPAEAPAEPEALDPAVEERLRSLGYID